SQNQDLSFNPPNKNEQGTISYISDPNNPVPWSTEKRITQGHLWMVEDQRFVANREDVIIFQTVPIQKDLSIGGPIYVKLYFSSTGTDMDWIVKLIDVYPEKDDKEKTINNEIGGSQILLSADVFRSKYRNNFENPEPIIPYSIDSIRFNIGDKLHTFKKGHRIMIQIQNSWFPLIDRNPQQFMDIYKVNENDYKIEENTLYFKYPYLSKIEIPVLK
ncbi:MAG: CocE/NonD family hydrolase, partial [Bacteroidetes bacterium]|nr:CocE/NonD family hydrolase [Bacteroidota bacterium]